MQYSGDFATVSFFAKTSSNFNEVNSSEKSVRNERMTRMKTNVRMPNFGWNKDDERSVPTMVLFRRGYHNTAHNNEGRCCELSYYSVPTGVLLCSI